ncbi:MAG: ATP-grasp domain-containing protein [Planctomycetes bacterium]|nr:ATP-grasp domain-containing protein [Planctomycetota bacterium]MCB9890997.1 ATP-grasp domain-containing protein [Planctomycetota bacterium]MCB9919150.1 ATP-grasp domain-containing protein [Planctomycetota bacterium]
MKVAILHQALPANARADESDVLEQVRAIGAALVELGHAQSTVVFDGDIDSMLEQLHETGADVAFNLVESVDGGGEAVAIVPAALEREGIPFTGSDSRAMTIAGSKVHTKARLEAHGLPSPSWFSNSQLDSDVTLTASRYIVKSVWEHGSLGLEADSVVTVRSPRELREEIVRRCPDLGGEAIAEAYVHGREFNLALLARGRGVEHLPAAEIDFQGDTGESPRVVGYRAKWSPGSPEDLATPRSFGVSPSDASLVARMESLAAAVWSAFGLAGYARIDFRVDDGGDPWIIDVNVNPCLSPDAGFAAALDEAGIRFASAIERILDAAMLVDA